MKYLVLIGDGMADYPIDEIEGRTVLQYARTPNMDYIAGNGINGFSQTVPEGMTPGSDIANMSILGYDPEKYYSGRAPLEAASMEIILEKDDVAFRCNLVTLKDDILEDYSAGHISTELAETLIKSIDSDIGSENIRFYPGMNYKHLLLLKKGKGIDAVCTPPHDIMGQEWERYLPHGKDGDFLSKIIRRAHGILSKHPVNIERIKSREKPANSIWLWGQGYAPAFPEFKQLYGLDSAVISAVDLVKGIGIYAGIDVIEVPGATGYFDTDYRAKAEYAIKALEDHDIVFVHVEAPDEAGHMGSVEEKIKAIENFDQKVVGTILSHILNSDEEYTVLITADHPTPISLRTHTTDPVPFAIYSTALTEKDNVSAFDEDSASNGSMKTVRASNLIRILLEL